MTEQLAQQLRSWAEHYNNRDLFLANDPIQVPNRYRNASLQDLEISALLTAYLSFGNRKQIVKTALLLDDMMNHQPRQYLLSKLWEKDFPANDTTSFYRTVSHQAMNELFTRLYLFYTVFDTLEHAVNGVSQSFNDNVPFHKLCRLLGVTDKSPQKKLNMFLRWMVRTDGIVDFGVWRSFSPSELIIPLDTHVAQMAAKLGLVPSQTYSLNTAKTITRSLSEVFPGDPCLGDFALFGYGVEND